MKKIPESRAGLVAALLLAIILGACSSSREVEVINPYLEKAKDFTADGMAAMQRERWDAAERAFSRSLRAAQLADDAAMVRLSWYNLGVVRQAMNRDKEADEAYRRAAMLAARQGDTVMQLRAELAESLMHARRGGRAALPALPKRQLPVDVYLQHARLAQLLGRPDEAARSYRAAIAASRRNPAGLRMRAQAHMGLALLYKQQGDGGQAQREVEKALDFCHEIGAPRLSAHALLLKAELDHDAAKQRDYLERALAIYTAVADRQGQRQVLGRLMAVAEKQGDKAGVERSRMMLQSISPRSPLSVPGAASGP